MRGSIILLTVIVILVILFDIVLFVQINQPTQSNQANNSNIKVVGNVITGEISVNSSTATNTTFKPTNPKTYNVEIIDFAFSPNNLTIKRGDSIVWVNHGNEIHTVTSDSGTELDSDTLSKDYLYDHTFDNSGNYTYHCYFHPEMTGKIIVK